MEIILVLLASLFGFVACGSSPQTRFFTLEPQPPSTASAPPIEGTPITVDAVHLPPVLDRLELVRHASPDRLVVSDQDRWGVPLDQLARRVLARDLAARLWPGLIVEPGAPRPPGPTRGLTVAVQEFDINAAGRVVLDAEWTLLAGRSAKPVTGHPEHIEVDVAADGSEAQAAAMSRALGVLADRIVATLAANRASQLMKLGKQDGDARGRACGYLPMTEIADGAGVETGSCARREPRRRTLSRPRMGGGRRRRGASSLVQQRTSYSGDQAFLACAVKASRTSDAVAAQTSAWFMMWPSARSSAPIR
jgi:uncharacterized protein